MGGGESSGAAHGDQGIDGTDAKFGGARTITIVRARKAKEGLSAVMQIFASGVEVAETVFAPYQPRGATAIRQHRDRRRLAPAAPECSEILAMATPPVPRRLLVQSRKISYAPSAAPSIGVTKVSALPISRTTSNQCRGQGHNLRTAAVREYW